MTTKEHQFANEGGDPNSDKNKTRSKGLASQPENNEKLYRKLNHFDKIKRKQLAAPRLRAYHA